MHLPLLRLLLTIALSSTGLLVALPSVHAASSTIDGKRCTMVGTSGSDVLVGTSTRDVICGRGGNDVIKGMGGNDIIDGGPGRDRILGGAGNDDLAGGTGVDYIDGGIGTDWCTLDSVDQLTRCVYDREKPTGTNLRLGPGSRVVIDGQAVEVSFTLDVADDTGVRQVQVMAQDPDTGRAIEIRLAGLISGTVRQGTWRATAVLSRYAAPGQFVVEAVLTDRVGRSASVTFDNALRIENRNADTTPPNVELLAPAPTTVVDVRDSSRWLLIRARITDSLSGVADAPYFCAEFPMDDFYTHNGCIDAERVSGTIKDGIWEARVLIPARSIGGDWNVSVWASDNAQPAERMAFVGPDIFRAWTMDGAETTARLFPGDRGRFTVRGTTDSNAPRLESVELTPAEVDTLERAAQVTLRVRATDVEGVSDVGAVLHAVENDASNPSFMPVDLTLTAGDARDGWWTATLSLPQGTPPGRYALQVWVRDATHWRSYVSASSPHAGSAAQVVLIGDPVVTVLER